MRKQLKKYLEQNHWDSGYENVDLEVVNKLPINDLVKTWLIKYLARTNNKSCFEIGCFPGRYLTVFGEFGYQLNGIDLTPRVKKDLPNWFGNRGFKTGAFLLKDFFELEPIEKFDVVFSMGFIEHFSNWKDLVKKHSEFTNDLVIIITPNFRGIIQRILHLLLDKENLKRHNLKSMRPAIWAKILEKEGFEVLFKGNIGKFDFWVEKQKRNKLQERLLRIVFYRLSYYLKKFSPNRFLSPYYGVVAKRIIL